MSGNLNKLFILPFLFLLLFIFKSNSEAVEIYNFQDSHKNNSSGFVLGIDENALSLLSLNGKLKVINKKNITALYVYNIVQNPIKTLSLTEELAEYLREVYLADQSEPSFIGFPFKMIDEMVIFFDLTGKIHVHLLSDLVKLRKYNFEGSSKLKLTNFKKIILDTGTDNKQNPFQQKVGSFVYPTKIFKGKININKYFLKAQDDFRKIYSYQERTFLYAKPIIFNQDFKMGNALLFRSLNFEEAEIVSPYVQWSNAVPYGFQSKTTIGKTSSEWLPELYPLGIIQSEVKMHFFNTLFIGNLNLKALPAGNRYYTLDYENYYNEYQNNLNYPYDPQVETNFNYALLLGGDYGPFSTSLGMFYPIYALNINDHFREILPTGASPMFRFVYFKGPLKFKTIFSLTENRDDDSSSVLKNLIPRYTGEYPQAEKTEEIEDCSSGECQISYNPSTIEADIFGYTEYLHSYDYTPVKEYKLNSYFIRLGLTYELTSSLQISFDEIITVGKYSETFYADKIEDVLTNWEDKPYPSYRNTLNFKQYKSSLAFYHRFSDYVAVKGIYNFHYNIYKYDFFTLKDKKNKKIHEGGGSFELIF